MGVEGEFGKQLDSLADMVTSGVVPGFMMFQLMLYAVRNQWLWQMSAETGNWESMAHTYAYGIPFFAFIIPLAAAYRLANFNIDERQSNVFLGLPTPAMAIFVVSLPLILEYGEHMFFVDLVNNIYVLVVISLLGALVMNVEISLFSLKFKTINGAETRSNIFSSLVLWACLACLDLLQFR